MALLVGLAVVWIPSASAAACAAPWSASAVYTNGQTASHGGKNWRAKWWTQGEMPGTTGQWGVWEDQGACGGGGNPPPPPPPPPGNPPPPPPPGGSCTDPAWAEGRTYTAGTRVSYNGRRYEALVTHTAHPGAGWNPASTPTLWRDLGSCGGGNNPPPPPPPPGNPPPPPPPPPGGFVVTEAQFNQMFPSRNPFYTYNGLTTAMNSFTAFARTGSDTIRKQEAAAFLANVGHETGGLVHITEINKNNDLCDESQPYGCPAGTFAYYGRGPIQLSWNFNYHAAGNALGLPLLTNPYLVEQNASIAWQTALWYWMTQNGPGTMTAHNAMVNQRGFGETIRSINGSLECNGGNPAQVQSRVNNYQRFVGILGVPPGGNLTC
ncbi:MAG TPA: glycoside hydrolase family 19 protein [Pilimelia sp.]|nr:glycoside hydrolase family 19 protein [Pilimelia sp.]